MMQDSPSAGSTNFAWLRCACTTAAIGTNAEAGEYPWQVQVIPTKGQSEYLCGGTLIAEPGGTSEGA